MKNKRVFDDSVVVCGKNLCVRMVFNGDKIKDIRLGKKAGSARTVSTGRHPREETQMKEYLQGRPVQWDCLLETEKLTPFQKKVFTELAKVPFGKTVTYTELAEKVKGKNYRRAVAMALSANPFPIVIPCHRVTAANGLGGFSCGVNIKKILLRLEGCKDILRI